MALQDKKLPPVVESAIIGRVPTPWLVEHMHEFTKAEFYDQSLTEDDLKQILARMASATET